jgi:hypothetical protein
VQRQQQRLLDAYLAGVVHLAELDRKRQELHRVKDVSLGEDRSLIHQGQGPTVMALLRDAAVSLLQRAGVRQITARSRYHSQHPTAAVALHMASPPADA